MRTLFKKSERRTTISAVVTVLAVLLIGALVKSEGASHLCSDGSLGGLGEDFPKRACSPAMLTACSFLLSSEPLWNSYRKRHGVSRLQHQAKKPVQRHQFLLNVPSESSYRGSKGGCNARYFMHDVCDCVVRREQLVGRRAGGLC